ncbi:MAG: tripartite tricarboxylate transporter substrate binding protein [Oscillospiraceae bacterium]|nr:tripartite tricarboxylate transporter substrate binding protein [Oscillospiraceae bacterium]
MKGQKRIVTAILAAFMLLSLAACDSGAAKNSQAPSAPPTESGAPEKSAAPEVQWPKNIEIVVPAGAGGDTDFNARALAEKLNEKLPANVVVSNVNGGGGSTGSRQVKNAEPDGSSVLFYHTAFLVNKASGTTDYGFDEFSLACIAAMSRGNVVTVRAELGINTLQELYDYTQAHPGELKMAAQTGATSYAISMQMKAAGFDMNVVDAGGAADRLAAIAGGHVDVILAAYGSIKDYVAEGTLVALAMDGEADLTVADQNIDVKAIHNLGHDSIKLPFYYFLAFPKGTDEALVQAFSDAVKDIVENDADYQQKIYDTYLQEPFYKNTEDGTATFAEIEQLLETVDLTGKVEAAS